MRRWPWLIRCRTAVIAPSWLSAITLSAVSSAGGRSTNTMAVPISSSSRR